MKLEELYCIGHSEALIAAHLAGKIQIKNRKCSFQEWDDLYDAANKLGEESIMTIALKKMEKQARSLEEKTTVFNLLELEDDTDNRKNKCLSDINEMELPFEKLKLLFMFEEDNPVLKKLYLKKMGEFLD